MSIKHQPVVVAYDFSTLGRAVLDRAVALVTRAPSHVLHFVTVIDPHSGVPVVPHEGKIDYQYADRVREHMLGEIKTAFGTAEIPAEIHFFLHARIGKPTKEIIDLAEEVGADLILIGTHGFRGLERLMMGSTAEHVVREAGCPVLVVRPKAYPDIELPPVVEVERKEPIRSRVHRYSYTNSNVIMRPPEWPIQ